MYEGYITREGKKSTWTQWCRKRKWKSHDDCYFRESKTNRSLHNKSISKNFLSKWIIFYELTVKKKLSRETYTVKCGLQRITKFILQSLNTITTRDMYFSVKRGQRKISKTNKNRKWSSWYYTDPHFKKQNKTYPKQFDKPRQPIKKF